MKKLSTLLSNQVQIILEKHLTAIVITIIMAIVFLLPLHTNAQLTWRTDGTAGTWTGTNWSATGTSPFSAWVPSTNAIFNNSASNVTFATTTVGNITVNPGFNVTIAIGGTLSTNGTSVVTVGSGSTLTWNKQVMNTAVSFDKEGAGTWQYTTGGTQTITGAGAMTLGAGTLSSTGGGTNLLGTGTLTINGGTLSASGSATFSNPIVVGGNFTIAPSGTLTFGSNINLGGSVRTITMTGTTIAPTFSGIISNGGLIYTTTTGLTSGTGGIVLVSGTANTYTGSTTITSSGSSGAFSPEVDINADLSLGAAPGSAVANSIVLDGGRLGTSASFTLNSNRGIQVSAAAGTSLSAKTGATLTYNGIIANMPSTIGSWAKQGSGILILGSSTTCTYSGATGINNGTLQLGASSVLPSGTTVNIGTGGTSSSFGIFDLNGNNQQIAGLISNATTSAPTTKNTVTTSTSSSTFTIGGSGTYSYGDATSSSLNSGIITGAVSLVANGGGTQTLGDLNTYTGTTQITNGSTLIFTPGITGTTGATENLSSSAVTLNAGTLSTSGIHNGSSVSFSTLNLQGASSVSTISLGSNGHTLSFADSHLITWGDVHDSVRIYGWQGGYNGTSGTNAEIFVGAGTTALTTQQLSQIEFVDGSGNVHKAALLSTGELVPLVFTAPALLASPTSINFSAQTVLSASSPQQFSLSGSNLSPATGTITVTAPSTDFEVSSNGISFGPTASFSYSAGTLNNALNPNVWVEFTPQAAGHKSGNITATGGGAATATVTVSGDAQYTYKSAQTGNWSSTSTWVGGIVPQAASDIVEIQNGNTVTVDVTDNNIVSLTIDAGGTLSLTNNINSIKINSGAASTLVNGTLSIGSLLTTTGLFTSTSLEIGTGGVFTNSAGNAHAVSIADFSVDANATYNHDAIGTGSTTGATTDFPGSSSITLDNASTVVFTHWGIANQSPVNFPLIGSWGNLTLNLPAGQYYATGSWGQKASVNEVHGTFNVMSTGGQTFSFTKSAALPILTFDGDVNISGGSVDVSNTATNVYPTVNIAGNLNVSGTGAFHLNEAASGSSEGASEILNLTGNLNISGGSVFFDEAASGAGVASAGPPVVLGTNTVTANIGGNLIVSGGTLDLNTAASGSGVQTVNVNLNGDLAVSGSGTIIRSGAGSVALANFYFDKSTGTQNFVSTSGGINSNKVSWNVGDGSTTNTLQLNSDFKMSASSLLTINSSNSIIIGASNVHIDSALALLGSSTVNINGNTLQVDMNTPIAGTGTFTSSSTSKLIVKGGTAGAGTINFSNNPAVLKNLTLTVSGASGYTTTTATLGSPLNIVAGIGDSVTVNSGATLNTGGNLTLKSDATGTARVGNSAGTISGNAIVERYIPGDGSRAWRILSVPTYGSQTLQNSWQQNTWITTGNAANLTNGFDAVTNFTSMQTYNAGSSNWVDLNSTTNAINNNPGYATPYAIYVRGARDATPTNSTIDATTLSTAGSLYNGSVTVPISSGPTFSLIGNPFASEIDFNGGNIIFNGINSTVFYIWDPSLVTGSGSSTSYGHYQTFSSTNGWVPFPGGGSNYPNTANTKIESGQAFFVQNTIPASATSLVLPQSSKTISSNDVFRPASPENISGLLRTNLYELSGSSAAFADANLEVFNNIYSNTVDANDALKLENGGENFGIQRDSKLLEIEGRQAISASDTIFYDMWNMKQQQYQLQFVPSNINATGLTAYLQDSYLGTSTAIDLANGSTATFSVDGNAASSASNRFRIVFNNSNPLPVIFIGIQASQKNTDVTVSWQVTGETGIQQYVVERSKYGTNFSSIGTVTAKGSSGYSFTDAAPNDNNFYRIESIGITGGIKYTGIVKVSMGSLKPGIAIYPNPVTEGKIGLQLTNQPAGNYYVRLLNITGQELYKNVVSHNEGSSIQTLNMPSELAKGVYKLEVVSPDKNVFIQKLILK